MLNLERLKEQKGGIVKKNNMSQKRLRRKSLCRWRICDMCGARHLSAARNLHQKVLCGNRKKKIGCAYKSRIARQRKNNKNWYIRHGNDHNQLRRRKYMNQKRVKQAKKHTVKEVLASIEWSIEDGELILLSRLSDEFITIDMEAIINKNE